ncbi:MAG: hypothetical protein ACO1RT_13435 [Planctomycetaceae bacterium]
MVEPSSEKELKKGEWRTAIVVAVIGLLTTVSSQLLPWLLYDSSDVVSASQSVAVVAADVTKVANSWPNLTHGAWTITASVDEEGTDFSNSTLRFTSQTDTPQGLQLEGFFEWRGNDILLGREHFRADLDGSNRQLFIQGLYIESFVSPPRLAVGSFSSTLSADGRQLVDGTWGNTPGKLPGVLGTWTARR